MKTEVSPSILSADFGKLNEEVASVEPFCDRLHIDVMDGHFVPNISFGAPVYKWIKTRLPLDVHLMIEHPWEFFDDFIKAGANTLTIHEEVFRDGGYEGGLSKALKVIANEGVLPGVSVKPGTPVEKIKDVLDLVDYILIMTVEPGFGGQDFMPEMVEKIRKLRDFGFEKNISVDGGINSETGKICVDAGANVLVAGSYIFKAEDRKEAIESLKLTR